MRASKRRQRTAGVRVRRNPQHRAIRRFEAKRNQRCRTRGRNAASARCPSASSLAAAGPRIESHELHGVSLHLYDFHGITGKL